MKGITLFVIVFYCTLVLGQLTPTTRILFILDASNSMNSSWGSQTRIQAARDVLNQELEALRNIPNTEIALRIYGHQTPFNNLEQDCNDTKLEVPFGSNNLENIKLKIKTVEAKGATPIARSLEAAAADFPDTLARNIIILITDGLESCDNDPCVIAKKLKTKGVKVTPFVIGLGMDMSYLDKFSCIGTYSDAEDKESFRNVFKNILNTVLEKTSVQVNLNDLLGKPTETNVTMFFYESGTANLKYTFVHTINRFGNPDTLYLDPEISYDLKVNTTPTLFKSGISLNKHVHNIINVSAPQGFIRLTSTKSNYNPKFEMRVVPKGDSKTLLTQFYNETSKYLVGTYDLEIYTIPRIYKTVEVTQSTVSAISIDAPGELVYNFNKPLVAQLFLQDKVGYWNGIYTFSDVSTSGKLLIQPGTYKLVYRTKEMKSSGYTHEKIITITSNKTNTLNIN
ncbi:MAG: vWA domain-containing protein [Flavobacteriales bacterium]